MSNNKYRKDFPILNTTINGKGLVYLDNAATTQKPFSVIHSVEEYYGSANANPHRGLYRLSVKATEIYENARRLTRDFIGARRDEEIIFTKSATESLNLVAYSYGLSFIGPEDEIVLSVAEHHSNLVPWQQVARATGATLKYMYPDSRGQLSEEEIESKISPKTKLVAAAYVSNVLGTINPVEKIIQKAHAAGAVVVLDCAQSIPHIPLDVAKLDVDFAAFSGHKMLAPMGIGVLYGKKELLDKMPPFLSGGDMIEYVREQDTDFAPLPAKFEAGTQNVGGALGLAKAIEYIRDVGYEKIEAQEAPLIKYALDKLTRLPYITIYGADSAGTGRCGIISFNVEDVHPHDVASILDTDGIAIRAGHHCAQPLMRYLGINSACRLSLYLYNTLEDIDLFIESLKKVREILGHGA